MKKINLSDYDQMTKEFLDNNKSLTALLEGKRKCTPEDAKAMQDFIGEMGVKMGVYKHKEDIWDKRSKRGERDGK